MKRQKVPISERALHQRINRKLEADGETLKRTLKGHVGDLGDFYVLDMRGGYIARHDVDIEELGREMGCLKPFEVLEQKEEKE